MRTKLGSLGGDGWRPAVVGGRRGSPWTKSEGFSVQDGPAQPQPMIWTSMSALTPEIAESPPCRRQHPAMRVQ